MKLRSSVESEVELRTRRTNQLNQISKKFFLERESIYTIISIFYFISLVRRMWGSMFVPQTIFRRSIRLKQTDRTCWTIQTHSDKPNWARRRTFHECNSPNLVRLMKSSTFASLRLLQTTTFSHSKVIKKPRRLRNITFLEIRSQIPRLSATVVSRSESFCLKS